MADRGMDQAVGAGIVTPDMAEEGAQYRCVGCNSAVVYRAGRFYHVDASQKRGAAWPQMCSLRDEYRDASKAGVRAAA